MDTISKLAFARGASFLQVATIGLFTIYEVAHMSSRGLSGTTIGILLAVENGLLLATGTLWGWVADRFGCYRELVMASVLVSAFNLFWLSGAETVFDFSIYVLIRGVSFTAMMTVMPALAMSNLSKEGLGRAYSRYRVFGSIGFIVGSVVLPMFFNGISSILLAGACILPFSILFVWGLDNPDREFKKVDDLKKSKGLPSAAWWYLAAHFLISFTEPGNIGFLNDYVLNLGGSAKLIGWYSGMTGFMALISLPLMGKWVDSDGIRWVLALGFLSQTLRPLTISLIQDPNWLWISQLFHFFGWAGREVGSIVFMTLLLGVQRRAFAVSLVVTVRTAGMMVGAYLMGRWADVLGYDVMFRRIFSIASFSLPLLFIAFRAKESKFCNSR